MDMLSTGLIGLADDPALEFLNSTAEPARGTVEFLEDGQAYLEWLVCAGLLDEGDRAAVRPLFSTADLDDVAAQAVALRERVRPVVARWAAGEPGDEIPSAVRSLLDDILQRDRGFFRVPRPGAGDALVRARHWHEAQQLLVPVAEATARLLFSGDRSLVRRCEGPSCSLWFYDRTKSHRRRWCSMAVCGNRAKARTHRERTR